MTAETILIVEDHARIGKALVRTLAENGFGAALVPTVEECLSQLEKRSFDVVLLDLLLPGIHGLDGLQLIKTRAPRTKVIVVTGTATVDVAVACIKRGAEDVITKPFDPNVVVDAVESCMKAGDGESAGPGAQRDDSAVGQRLARAASMWSLSKRQIEVLSTLVHGSSNKDIALQLGCSESTVELHVTALLKKSGAGSRTELVARFWMLGA